MNATFSKHDILLIVIAVLLALILLTGVGFGFYYLGTKKGSIQSGAQNSAGQLSNNLIGGDGAQNGTGYQIPNYQSGSSGSNGGSSNIQSILEGLQGESGEYDPIKIESQLSGLLSGQNGQYNTTIPLVSASEVKTTSASGASAIQSYINAVNNAIQGSQTTSMSDSALSGLFSGDTSALDAEIAKNQAIYTKLRNIAAPAEAAFIHQEYLTLFKASVEVMQAEKAMITGSNVNYAALAQAQGLLSLSKKIDSEVASLKVKYNL